MLTKNLSRQWFDRNPLSVGAVYQQVGQAPAAPTSRFTYTVPANRKCYVESAEVFAIRDAAGGPARVRSYLGCGVGYIVNASHFSATVDGGRVANMGGGIFIAAADSLVYTTEDLSGGGTNFFFGTFKGTEFDA